MQRNYSVILGNLGNTCDRFLSTGYKDVPEKDQMLEQIGRIEQVRGIELVGTWDVDENNYKQVKVNLEKKNLACVSIIPDHFAQKKWGKGAFTSTNPAIRRDAVTETKAMVDIAIELDCDLLNIWNGQDGFDYPLSTNYLEERTWLTEGLSEVARYAAQKKIRLALEYKVKEPRNHSYVARMADTLLLVNTIGLNNVGVCIDTGHAFMAYENVGESIVLAAMAGNKLFHMHFNDNHTSWDDDMIVGSIHLPEYFEIVYWLEKTGYAGWFSMDQYPYREDGYGAIRSSVLFIQRMHAILDRVGIKAVDDLIAKRDPIATAEFIRENLLAK